MPGAYFISYFSALGMEPAFLKISLLSRLEIIGPEKAWI